MFSQLSSLLLFTLITYINAVVVVTKNGEVSGTVFTTNRGRIINAFLGVPYARPPTDNYRFREPQPVENWEGVRNAHNFSSKCIQYTYYKFRSDPIIGNEDCLYLNIFTPIVSDEAKLDVIFFIHGGAWMFGSGNDYTPDYILDDKDFVFVTINYRVGIFGFLTTEDGVIPGNIGLKDQVQALRWVHENIEQFGGDKARITLAGLSAGGASVHYHYLSPLSRDLFAQGISQSASALNPWALAENAHKKAEMLSESVDCPTEDSELLLKCLQTVPAKTLLSHVETLFIHWNYTPMCPFGPVVENNSSSAFLTKNPYTLMKEGDVKDAPWLVSITTEEGLYPGAWFVNNGDRLRDLDENWNDIAPHLLDYFHTIPNERLNEVSDKIRRQYFDDSPVNKEQRTNLIKMISDRLYVADVERAARLQASIQNAPVFFYRFGYRGKYSVSNFLCRCKDDLGASHTDDNMYILKPAFALNPMETKEDQEMVKTMVNIWSSFVKGGVPITGSRVKWIPVFRNTETSGNLAFLHISSSKDVKPMYTEELCNKQFWDDLQFEELWNTMKKQKRYIDEL